MPTLHLMLYTRQFLTSKTKTEFHRTEKGPPTLLNYLVRNWIWFLLTSVLWLFHLANESGTLSSQLQLFHTISTNLINNKYIINRFSICIFVLQNYHHVLCSADEYVIFCYCQMMMLFEMTNCIVQVLTSCVISANRTIVNMLREMLESSSL